jgi:hypothetical protein
MVHDEKLPESVEFPTEFSCPAPQLETQAIEHDRRLRTLAAVQKLPLACRQVATLTPEGFIPQRHLVGCRGLLRLLRAHRGRLWYPAGQQRRQPGADRGTPVRMTGRPSADEHPRLSDRPNGKELVLAVGWMDGRAACHIYAMAREPLRRLVRGVRRRVCSYARRRAWGTTTGCR